MKGQRKVLINRGDILCPVKSLQNIQTLQTFKILSTISAYAPRQTYWLSTRLDRRSSSLQKACLHHNQSEG